MILRYALLGLFLSHSCLHAWSIPGFGRKTQEAAPQAAEAAADKLPSIGDLSKSLTESVAAAQASLGNSSPDMKAQLAGILQEATKGQDMAMLDNLKGLANLPGAGLMTPGQKQLVQEVQGHAQALALTRNFGNDPALAGPVSKAVQAVQSRDPMAAATSLKAIADQGSLSPIQQMMIKSMLGNYSSYLDAAQQAAGAAGALKGLF